MSKKSQILVLICIFITAFIAFYLISLNSGKSHLIKEITTDADKSGTIVATSTYREYQTKYGVLKYSEYTISQENQEYTPAKNYSLILDNNRDSVIVSQVSDRSTSSYTTAELKNIKFSADERYVYFTISSWESEVNKIYDLLDKKDVYIESVTGGETIVEYNILYLNRPSFK